MPPPPPAAGPPSPIARDGSPAEPDPALTPGAADPRVTQATIGSTICASGYTSTVRPPTSYTTPLTREQIGEIVGEILTEQKIQLNQIEQRDLVTLLLNEMLGLGPLEPLLADEAITAMIRSYTREAGVRNLEREIGNICRKVARKVVKDKEYSITITAENVNDFLGVTKFRDTQVHERSEVGLVTGRAWTEVGGAILAAEACTVDGKGKLLLTGKLGDVMQGFDAWRGKEVPALNAQLAAHGVPPLAEPGAPGGQPQICRQLLRRMAVQSGAEPFVPRMPPNLLARPPKMVMSMWLPWVEMVRYTRWETV